MVEKYAVPFITETKVEEITDTGVVVIDKAWKRYEIPAETVILSLGFRARNDVVNRFRDLDVEVYAVGDCLRPQAIKEAVHDGFNVAVEL